MTCKNTKCQYHTARGCKLFPGKSWMQCKSAVIPQTAKPQQKEADHALDVTRP